MAYPNPTPNSPPQQRASMSAVPSPLMLRHRYCHRQSPNDSTIPRSHCRSISATPYRIGTTPHGLNQSRSAPALSHINECKASIYSASPSSFTGHGSAASREMSLCKMSTTTPYSSGSTSNTSLLSLTSTRSTLKTQHTVHMAEKIPSCPNAINGKCRCSYTMSEHIEAQRIWSACYRIRINNENYKMDDREIEVAYFDGLYTGLCHHLKVETDSDRVPTKQDIADIIHRFGGFTLENGEVVMDRCHFVTFSRWFFGTCEIIKDVYNLWDTKYPFQLNLFMNRRQCEDVLKSASQGTFVVRLSSRQNALAISYSEKLMDKTTKIKHILLVRKSCNNYMVKTNDNSLKYSEVDKLIRAFGKLQFIYTPNCIYKKKHVF